MDADELFVFKLFRIENPVINTGTRNIKWGICGNQWFKKPIAFFAAQVIALPCQEHFFQSYSVEYTISRILPVLLRDKCTHTVTAPQKGHFFGCKWLQSDRLPVIAITLISLLTGTAQFVIKKAFFELLIEFVIGIIHSSATAVKGFAVFSMVIKRLHLEHIMRIDALIFLLHFKSIILYHMVLGQIQLQRMYAPHTVLYHQFARYQGIAQHTWGHTNFVIRNIVLLKDLNHLKFISD